jgi:3-hydroxybutyryl-CoA dehydrogenase
VSVEVKTVGIIGAGTMGAGIAQVAATAGCKVIVMDSFPNAIENAKAKHEKDLQNLVDKSKITETQKNTILQSIQYTKELTQLSTCELVIEAVIEDLKVKQDLFSALENIVSDTCILSSNTSSLSIAAISSVLKNKKRFIGIHFFNPAPIMPLVEIIPGVATAKDLADDVKHLMLTWKKLPVITKDAPGFIVNRVARPYYSEAIRIYEEGMANFETIDFAMKTLGGFRMGPFELMDFIGHDVNYRVTESVWTQLFYDPRFRPSITQKRLFEAGLFGKKAGVGFYAYNQPTEIAVNEDKVVLEAIFKRILNMLINEAYDALYLKIAEEADLETAMLKGVNYPKGLIAWGLELGLEVVLQEMNTLYERYQEERYRPSMGLKHFISKK